MRAALAMDAHLPERFFTPNARAALATQLELAGDAAPTVAAALRSDLEVLITGWGVQALTRDDLDAMPKLRAIIHAGGGIGWIDGAAWERGILVASAADANAIPVAEYTFAMILLAAKDVPWVSRRYVQEQSDIDREADYPSIGAYGTSVGIVGASRVGSRVLASLATTAFETSLFDPYCSAERAAELGARKVDDLVEVASASRILSVHAPATDATQGLISREVLAALPDGATLINTARGALVDQDALVDELRSGRLRAILDVTTPEVLHSGHPLYELPNVVITPHLSGSAGNELFRLGDAVAENVARLAAGQSLVGAVSAADRARQV
ncbi:hydroxyacid dehydrogenase [Agromyces atrinae]|nr:hydroxyacid dehydrogenase [Agromyces atrinae]